MLSSATAPTPTASPTDALNLALTTLGRVIEGDHDALSRCQAHAMVARTLMQEGEIESGEWYWQQALRWARTSGDSATILDVLAALGAASVTLARQWSRLGEQGSSRAAMNRARDQCFEALRLLHGETDSAREASALRRIATILADCGDHEDAEALNDRARRVSMGPVNASRLMDGAPASLFGVLTQA